jgi:hypothetical protein
MIRALGAHSHSSTLKLSRAANGLLVALSVYLAEIRVIEAKRTGAGIMKM